jgi:hypothetical protein
MATVEHLYLMNKNIAHGNCVAKCENLKTLVILFISIPIRKGSDLALFYFIKLSLLFMWIIVFWTVTVCSLVGGYKSFSGTYCLHLLLH